jgi:uncharacterized protein (TIGR02145 family)
MKIFNEFCQMVKPSVLFSVHKALAITHPNRGRNTMKKVTALLTLLCILACAQQDSFTDPRDGKKYKIVKIGNQTWMAQNLDYGGKDGNIGVCYDKKPANCKKYGALYSANEAKQVCPDGWHLPNRKEWQELIDFAGGKDIAGKKLKAKSDWSTVNKDGSKYNCKYTTTSGRGETIKHDDCATDEFGFAALPAGSFLMAANGQGSFAAIGSSSLWRILNSSPYNDNFDGLVGIGYNFAEASIMTMDIMVHKPEFFLIAQGLLPVRCIKDGSSSVTETLPKNPAQTTESFSGGSTGKGIRDPSILGKKWDPPKKEPSESEKALTAGFTRPTIKPSFNCAKASTPTEKAICSDETLAELDSKMAKDYKCLSSIEKGDFKNEQKEWVKKRDKCGAEVKCVETEYEERLKKFKKDYVSAKHKQACGDYGL